MQAERHLAPRVPRRLFDGGEGARNALRASSESARSLAGDFSNAAYALGAFPLVVDAGLVTWLGKGNADAAAQLALIDLEAVTITVVLTTRCRGRSGERTPSCANVPPIRTPTRIVPVRPIRETPPSSAAMLRWLCRGDDALRAALAVVAVRERRSLRLPGSARHRRGLQPAPGRRRSALGHRRHRGRHRRFAGRRPGLRHPSSPGRLHARGPEHW